MKYKLTKRIVILLNIDDVGISDIDAYIDLTRQNLLDAFG